MHDFDRAVGIFLAFEFDEHESLTDYLNITADINLYEW